MANRTPQFLRTGRGSRLLQGEEATAAVDFYVGQDRGLGRSRARSQQTASAVQRSGAAPDDVQAHRHALLIDRGFTLFGELVAANQHLSPQELAREAARQIVAQYGVELSDTTLRCYSGGAIETLSKLLLANKADPAEHVTVRAWRGEGGSR